MCCQYCFLNCQACRGKGLTNSILLHVSAECALIGFSWLLVDSDIIMWLLFSFHLSIPLLLLHFISSIKSKDKRVSSQHTRSCQDCICVSSSPWSRSDLQRVFSLWIKGLPFYLSASSCTEIERKLGALMRLSAVFTDHHLAWLQNEALAMPYHQPLPPNRSMQELDPPTGTGACRSWGGALAEALPLTHSQWSHSHRRLEWSHLKKCICSTVINLPFLRYHILQLASLAASTQKDLPASEAVIRALPHADSLVHDTD